jgi:myo-inositol-1(or 4)-monophosphatase
MGTEASLNLMIKAASKAAVGIVRDFGELEKLQVSRKGVGNFVTSSDKRAEEKIVAYLSSARPDISFICEEETSEPTAISEQTWIVDPIDGTTNFMRGIPHFAISIALYEAKQIASGIVLDPIRGELFKAERGAGAFMERKGRLRVSGRETLQEALIATRLYLRKEDLLVRNGAMTRKTGSVALDLAYVAAGKYDGAVFDNVRLWDMAAGGLLIQESGGFFAYTKHDDGSFDVVATSSSALLKKISDLYK